MVKFYLRHRFTRHNIPLELRDKALSIFGDFHLFQHTKVLHSHAVVVKEDGKLYQINTD